MQLPGPLLSPSSKKIKKSAHLPKIYISGNGTFLPQKNLNKTFLIFLASRNLIKLFYTLDKTPLGKTGCLSNLYYLLAGQAYQNCKKYIFENCFL